MMLPGFIISSMLVIGLAYYMYIPDTDILSSDSVFTSQFKSLCAYLRDIIYSNSAPEVMSRDDEILTKHESIDGVDVLIHSPVNTEGVLHPGIIYFHGGGWISGSTEKYKTLTQFISKMSGFVVISVEYRLAPEFPFPTAFEDCLRATLYLLRNPSTFGLLTNQITLAGDDVGGNLALSVSLNITKEEPTLSKDICLVGMFYPPLQAFDFNLPSYAKNTRQPGQIGKEDIVEQFSLYLFGENNTELVSQMMKNLHTTTEQKNSELAEILDLNMLPFSFREYSEPGLTKDAGNEQLSRDVSHLILDDRVSPMLTAMQHLENLPYTYFISPEVDPVRDESFMLYAALRELDMNKHEHAYYRGQKHGFLKHFHTNDIAKHAISEFIAHLKKTLLGER